MAVFLFEDKYLTEDELFEELDRILLERSDFENGVLRIMKIILTIAGKGVGWALPVGGVKAAAGIKKRLGDKLESIKNYMYNAFVNDPEVFPRLAATIQEFGQRVLGNDREAQRAIDTINELKNLYEVRTKLLGGYGKWIQGIGAGGATAAGLTHFLKQKGMNSQNIGNLPFSEVVGTSAEPDNKGMNPRKAMKANFQEMWRSKKTLATMFQEGDDSLFKPLTSEQIRFTIMGDVAYYSTIKFTDAMYKLIPGTSKAQMQGNQQPQQQMQGPQPQQAANDDQQAQQLAASRNMDFDSITRGLLSED